jgi:hypothetical protein
LRKFSTLAELARDAQLSADPGVDVIALEAGRWRSP